LSNPLCDVEANLDVLAPPAAEDERSSPIRRVDVAPPTPGADQPPFGRMRVPSEPGLYTNGTSKDVDPELSIFTRDSQTFFEAW